MKAGKLRGIIGNALILLFSICTLGFMALPMFSTEKSILGHTKTQAGESVFEMMGKVGDISNENMKSSLVLFIIVAILACALMITAIIGLVAVFTKNKKLNMTLVNRIVTAIMSIFALVAMILAVACTGESGVEGLFGGKTMVNAGAIMPLIFSLFTLAGAIIAPSKKKA